MEQVNLGYSTKNIPVPSKNTYLQILISSMEKLNHRMRWKAFFELNPETKSKSKETFGFKSTAPAPYVPELKEFQDKMINLAKNITFGNKPNHFQQKLRADEQRIKNESKAHIKADKSTNFYPMEGRQ